MAHPAVITLTTDFGLSDPFVGVMKGVILRCATNTTIVDLTHAVPPQNLAAASWLLSHAAGWFPRGTVHLAVVDPGVGSARRALAVRCREFTLVGPDNGIFTETLLRFPALEAVSIEPVAVAAPTVMSATFHGRDLFALAAAEIALGRPVSELGPALAVYELVHLVLPQPIASAEAITGTVRWIDRFGSLISDIVPAMLGAGADGASASAAAPPYGGWLVTGGDCTVRGILRTYADAADAELVALFGSSGTLELAVRNGSAAERTGIGLGARIQLRRDLV